VDETPRTVSLQKACEVAGVTRRTLYNWMALGKVEFVRTASGSPRIVTASLFRDGNVPADRGHA
jgi:predicted site-specific integrase-resolvase